MNEVKKIIGNGLWKNNPALVQILGLCPLLAVSNTAVNALGLGLATLFVLIVSNSLISMIRQWVRAEIRIPLFVLLIASAVTVIQILIQAFAYPLYISLGIYLPLIVTNCAIIGRAESYAVKHSLKYAFLDGLFMGLGFCVVIVVLGIMREILSQGSIGAGADLLLGDFASDWVIHIGNFHEGMVFAALPSGAFICYALIIALKNYIDDKCK